LKIYELIVDKLHIYKKTYTLHQRKTLNLYT